MTADRWALGLGLWLSVTGACSAHDRPHRRPPVIVPVQVTAAPSSTAQPGERRWLAGDHHVHSEFSVSYDPSVEGAAPRAIRGGDGANSIPRNAVMARRFGLSWMVSTDHGGPDHSKVNAEQAYPEFLAAREAVPDMILFYGMEFDTPGADHSSLILPRTEAERDTLFDIESRFAKREPWPEDVGRDTEPSMLEALRYMDNIPDRPVVIANHPSRSAPEVGVYGQTAPAELRDWNDTAPQVAIGMEGAPGHQADALTPDGQIDPAGVRGIYRRAPTMGGFDQMTARLGGFWDSMLGEGRRWWVTATSDSHRHYSEGGDDFWPGEYSKTYVHARTEAADILDGMRQGRIFVATGDLVSELDVTVRAGASEAAMGGELSATSGQPIEVTIRLRDPAAPHGGGRTVDVGRVDLILGEVTGPVTNRAADANPTTRVVRRFTAQDWTQDGEVLTMTHTLDAGLSPFYLRVRGTNGEELEPAPDPSGEDPWSDLWFYSNPVFVTVAPAN